MQITINENPNIIEIKEVMAKIFSELDPDDDNNFTKETDQELGKWISVEELKKYSGEYGKLVDARNQQNELVGIAFVGKENPITWPDGNKAELFIIGVSPQFRMRGIASKLISKCEELAKEMGAKKLVLNTNTLMGKTQEFYKKVGYKPMGILKDYYDNGDAVFLFKDL